MKFLLKAIIVSFYIITLNSFSQEDSIKTLFDQGKFEDVITALSTKDSESQLTLDEYRLLCTSYNRVRQYSNGLVYANKMIKGALKNKDTTSLLVGYNLKSAGLIDLNKIKEGIAFCESVAPLFREQDSTTFQSMCFKWGVMYYHDGQYQKAYNTYNKITIPRYKNITLYTNNYALTLQGLKKYEEAIEYYKKSISLARSREYSYNFSTYMLNIGLCLNGLNRLKEAKIYLDSSRYFVNEESQLVSKKKLYEGFVILHKKTKELYLIENYLDSIEYINEKIFDKKLNEKIDALEISYKKENELKNKVAEIDNELEQSRLAKLWWTIISLVLIISILSLIFFFKYKNIKSAHQQIVTEQKLLRSQMTPHFIFNSLSVLQGMILNKEGEKAVNYLTKFSKLLRLTLDNSREKLVTLNEELEAIQNYIDLQNMRREEKFNYELVIDKNIDPSMLIIPPMLIQPFVENAIIHGFNNTIKKPKITLELRLENNQLLCVIEDNGIGINNSHFNTNKESLATKITTERLEILSKTLNKKANLHICDRSELNEQGTLVNLIIPYKIIKNA